MTILPFKPAETNPHDVLTKTISEILNKALMAEEAFTVEEVANSIATAVQPTEDDLERFRIFAEYAAAEFIDAAGLTSSAEYRDEEYGDNYKANDLSYHLQEEVARGPAGWRDTDGNDRAKCEALALKLARAA